MLMAKSRHKKPESVRRYFKPSPEGIALATDIFINRAFFVLWAEAVTRLELAAIFREGGVPDAIRPAEHPTDRGFSVPSFEGARIPRHPIVLWRRA
jgi:hypothetical protein